MKSRLLIFSTLAFTLLANSVMAATEARFFRHLKFRETPYSAYQGIHPIDEQLAKTTAHYRFEYDNADRVVSIAHMIGDQLINDNGNWDTFIWFAPKVTIKYLTNQEIHQYHDVDNNRISAHGAVYTATYQLDQLGKRQSLFFSNENNEPSENAWGIHRYHWQHHNPKEITEKRFNLKDEQMPIRPVFHFYETHMTFDQAGQVQELKNYGLNGLPTNNDSGAGIDRIFYDFEGNFQRWHVYDKDGKPVEGNRPMVHIGEHLYDANGNKIGMRGFDVYGKPKTFSWGDSLIKREFDKFGNQIEGEIYNENNELVNKVKIEYSENGLRREWLKNYNALGQLVPSPAFGGAAAIKYEYEGNGLNASKTIPHDNNLKPMQ